MKKSRILIAEDDPKTSATIKLYLEHAGFETMVADDGKRALEEARSGHYELVVLDLMLPEIDGLSVCRLLRAESAMPVIMLTARTTEEDRLRGLDLGADDYVSKPFSPRELTARVRAVLRRTNGNRDDGPTEIRFDEVVINLRSREARVHGKVIQLTPTEFSLIETFAKSPGRAFTRRELVERALGWDFDGLERTIDAHIRNLRRKIDIDRDRPSYISTVFGVGYKFSGGRDDS